MYLSADIETTDSKIKVRLKLFKLPICYDKLLKIKKMCIFMKNAHPS
jgi:hypothetical protein